MPKRNEHQIQTQLINYLKGNGWYAQRMNSGKIPVGVGKYKRYVQLSPVGTPDIMAFKDFSDPERNYVRQLELIFIEVKVPGNKPTVLQNRKMEELESFGARCFVTHSQEELEEQLTTL